MALENDLASVPPQLGVLPPPPQTLTVVGATPSVVPLYLMVMAMVLMVPPGFPDFMSRTRVLRPGPVTIEGRAWSGRAPVERVEVSVDGGTTWAAAELHPARHQWAWRRWTFTWDARPGTHRIGSRAADDRGDEQPLEPVWNVGGYANNAVQWVDVTVP